MDQHRVGDETKGPKYRLSSNRPKFPHRDSRIRQVVITHLR